jgi:VIT1/CCC1 family predicted Fe2+/Mn2+ transporter
MARGRPPIFLQPEPYRQRRLIDAARLLPVFGTFLVLVPCLLLPRGFAGTTGALMIYLFLVWSLLIVFAAMITRYIRKAEARGNVGALREGQRSRVGGQG